MKLPASLIHCAFQKLNVEMSGLEIACCDLDFSAAALNEALAGAGVEVVALTVRRLEVSPRAVRGAADGVHLVLRPARPAHGPHGPALESAPLDGTGKAAKAAKEEQQQPQGAGVSEEGPTGGNGGPGNGGARDASRDVRGLSRDLTAFAQFKEKIVGLINENLTITITDLEVVRDVNFVMSLN